MIPEPILCQSCKAPMSYERVAGMEIAVCKRCGKKMLIKDWGI